MPSVQSLTAIFLCTGGGQKCFSSSTSQRKEDNLFDLYFARIVEEVMSGPQELDSCYVATKDRFIEEHHQRSNVVPPCFNDSSGTGHDQVTKDMETLHEILFSNPIKSSHIRCCG